MTETLTLPDRDAAFHAVIGGNDDELPGTTDLDDLREIVDEQQEIIKQLLGRVQTLEARVDGVSLNPLEDPLYDDRPVIERFAAMPEAAREDLLSSRQRWATAIFEHWRDWSQTVDAGEVISTNHTRGQNGKTAIKVDLEAEFNVSLQAVQVYRALEELARTSAPDPENDVTVHVDEYGRKHIFGGAFEYHDKVNPHASGTNQKYKLVKLVDPAAVTFP